MRSTLETRLRRIFLIVVDHGIELAVYADIPVDTPLGDVLDKMFATMLQDADADAETPTRLASYGDCIVMDDGMSRLPERITVGAVPAPGLVYVIPRAARSLADLELQETGVDGEDEDLDLRLFRELAFNSVRLDDTMGPRLNAFLSGPDALFEPDPLPAYDAFISFSEVDFLAASDLALELDARGIRSFLANMSISAGTLWNDELKIALRSSRRVLLVASRHAADSSWVWSELGAAWMLGIPIVVVSTDDAPEVWTSFLEGHDVKVVTREAISQLPELREDG